MLLLTTATFILLLLLLFQVFYAVPTHVDLGFAGGHLDGMHISPAALVLTTD
jgi:hypothetical protein